MILKKLGGGCTPSSLTLPYAYVQGEAENFLTNFEGF